MPDESTKKCNCIWWALGTLVIACLGVLLYMHVLTLQKNLEIARQNLAAAKDSVRYYQTQYGIFTQKYVRVITDKDSLAQLLEKQNRELVVYQEMNTRLLLQLKETQSHVTQIDENTLMSPIYNTYRDPGLVVNIYDTVTFRRANLEAPWVSYSKPTVEALMYYRMVIFKDEKGLLTGSVETFSPYLKATKLSTSIVDNYIPPSCTDEFPKVFGFSMGGSSQSVDLGIFLRVGSWGINPAYSFMMRSYEGFHPKAYDKLRLNIVKFIW
jgi:hypothetical protein